MRREGEEGKGREGEGRGCYPDFKLLMTPSRGEGREGHIREGREGRSLDESFAERLPSPSCSIRDHRGNSY